jgi:hypothetical protein
MRSCRQQGADSRLTSHDPHDAARILDCGAQEGVLGSWCRMFESRGGQGDRRGLSVCGKGASIGLRRAVRSSAMPTSRRPRSARSSTNKTLLMAMIETPARSAIPVSCVFLRQSRSIAGRAVFRVRDCNTSSNCAAHRAHGSGNISDRDRRHHRRARARCRLLSGPPAQRSPPTMLPLCEFDHISLNCYLRLRHCGLNPHFGVGRRQDGLTPGRRLNPGGNPPIPYLSSQTSSKRAPL